MQKVILFTLLVSGCSFSFAQTDTAGTKRPAIYTVVEQMPEFPGGEEALLNFINENLQYPSAEIAARIEGRVIVVFMVYEDGSVHDVVIKRGVSPGLDQEAKRVVEMLPSFKPGRIQGKAIRVSYILPINFKIGDGKITSVVSKITPQMSTVSMQSLNALKKWEEAFSLDCYRYANKVNGSLASIEVNFSLNKNGEIAAASFSGCEKYDERKIKKCMLSSLKPIRSLFSEELLGVNYKMSIVIK